MKRLILLLGSLIAAMASWSQPSQLIIHGETGKLYIEHTVSPKENWYSVGRIYNISPKEIAPFNGMAMNKPLEIGEQLKIPLKAVNFSQNDLKSAGETLVPVYHIIGEREWMYHISMTYNKVPIERLEKWNHINKDQAKAGMQLIVGYLKVKTTQSSLVNGTANKIASEPIAANDQPKLENDHATEKDARNIDPASKKQSVANHEAAVAGNGGSATDHGSLPVNSYAASHSTGGFFSMDFNNNNRATSGQAGTFKSTSGWRDGKYYALMNNVPVGTIVKIINPAGNKYVFAKVLGQLPEMKESAGLTIRISNAAASELGVAEDKFPVDIKY